MMNDLFEHAKTFIENKDYDGAVKNLTAVISSSPDHKQAHFELGKVYLIQNNFPPAVKELLKAVELNKNDPFARLLLAKAYRGLGNLPEAAKTLESLRSMNFKDDNIETELFDIYTELGQHERSFDLLSKLIDSNGYPERLKTRCGALIKNAVNDIKESNYNGKYEGTKIKIRELTDLVPVNDLRTRNILLNEQEIAERKTVLASKPRSALVVVTGKCNLDCIMCALPGERSWNMPENTKNELVALFPYLEKVIWQGGEAFLYEGFEDLLLKADGCSINQNIITNGLLLDDKMISSLRGLNNLELTFSIDGSTKEVYEHIRRGGRFDSLIKLLNKVKEAKTGSGLKTKLHAVIMRSNYRQLEDLINLAAQFNFDSICFDSMVVSDNKAVQEDIFFNGRDEKALKFIYSKIGDLQKQCKDRGIAFKCTFPDAGTYRTPREPNVRAGTGDDGSTDKTSNASTVNDPLFCHAPWQQIVITGHGSLLPNCNCLGAKYRGNNLKENSLLELWNGESMVEFRNKILSGEFKGFCSSHCVSGRTSKRDMKYV